VGHVLGLGDHADGNDIMTTTLEAGARRLPGVSTDTGALPGSPTFSAGATASAAPTVSPTVGLADAPARVSLSTSSRTEVGSTILPATSGAILDRASTAGSLAGLQFNLGPRTSAVLPAAPAVPAVGAVGSDPDSESAVVPGLWPPVNRVDGGGEDDALPSAEAEGAAPADRLSPRAKPADTLVNPDAEAQADVLRQQARDACFADGSWGAAEPSSPARPAAIAAAALAFLGGWWGAGRVETEERRRRFVR
jgi:hypothetical protein